MKRWLLFTLLVCLLFPTLSHSTVRYVANGGAGGSSCSSGQNISTPLSSISAGLACTVAGDTLYLRGNSGAFSASFRSFVETINSGTSFSNAVTIAGYPGDSTPQVNGGIDLSNGSGIQYVIFKDFFLNAAGVANNGAFIGANNIRMSNMEVAYRPGSDPETAFDNGIQVFASGGEYLNLRIHPASLINQSRTHGMYISIGPNLIDGVESYDNGGYGIQIYNGGNNVGAPGVIVRNCRLHHNGGSDNPGGLTVNSGDNSLIYNNLVYDNISGGGGIDATYSVQGAKIYNNTIWGNSGAAISISSLGSRLTLNIEAKNNIAYNNGSGIANNASGTTYGGNLCQNSGTGCAVVGNPLFVNPGIGNFLLQPGSAAIDIAVNLNSVFTTDLTGAARGGAWDAGAYEQSGGGGPPPPVNVRAEWLPRSMTGLLCALSGGDTNDSSTVPGSDYSHSLACTIPANTLQVGSVVRVCSLMQMALGSAPPLLMLKLRSGSTTLVAGPTSWDYTPSITSNAWWCSQLRVETAPGPTAATTSSVLTQPFGWSLDRDSNAIAQPVSLPTNADVPLQIASQWASAGTGGPHTASQIALTIEVSVP